MSRNLLVWKWAEDYNTPAKRRKAKIKFATVTSAFAQDGHHASMGGFDLDEYLEKLASEFGPEGPDRPFLVERYPQCIVLDYSESVRFEIVPVLGKLAMSLGLNAAEF
jgi:hypothetical protein